MNMTLDTGTTSPRIKCFHFVTDGPRWTVRHRGSRLSFLRRIFFPWIPRTRRNRQFSYEARACCEAERGCARRFASPMCDFSVPITIYAVHFQH